MKTIIVLIIAFLSGNAMQQLPSANEIVEKSREAGMSGSMKAELSLTIGEKNGSQRNRSISMISKSYADGTEKRYIRFLEPSDVRGTSLLLFDYSLKNDEMWIYLPALKKTRRIVSSEKGKSFMSSEFTNADMSSPSSVDFINKHMPGSGENGLWKIENKPDGAEKEDEYGFSRRISYIDMKNYQVKKMEFYNFDNELFKTITIKDVQLLANGHFIIKDMIAENTSNGRSSRIQFGKIETGSTIDDAIFTTQNLER